MSRPGANVTSYNPNVPEQSADGGSPNKRYMINGVGCCFLGVDLYNIMLCSKGDAEFCCLTHEHCLAANHDPLGIGPLKSTDTECCKLGCFCCTLGCKPPERLCRGAVHAWCCVQVNSFPLDAAYVDNYVAAGWGYQCLPENGCCKAYPVNDALCKIQECTTPWPQVMTRD